MKKGYRELLDEANAEIEAIAQSAYHKPLVASGKGFVFFCAGGWRSALATKAAQDMGLEPVRHILGGFSAWKTAGLPVETGAKKK